MATVSIQRRISFNPEDFGGVAGAANSTAVFVTMLAAAAAVGGVVIVTPGVWMVTALAIPSGIRMWFAPGAIIRRIVDTSGSMITMYDADDVEIEGGTFDGNRANYTGFNATNIVVIRGNASNIRLRSVIVRGAQGATAAGGASGDGMYIARGDGTEGTNGAIPQDISLDRVWFTDNVRQGLTIISVRNLIATGCWFTDQAGTDPGAGVDVEPNNAADVVEDVWLNGCLSRGNDVGFQIANAIDATVRNVFWNGGALIDNTVQGAFFIEVRGPHGVVGWATVRGNGSHGVQDRSSAYFKFQGYAYENGARGVYVERSTLEPVMWNIEGYAYLNAHDGAYIDPAVGGSFGSVHDFWTFNNGTAAATTYDGLHLNSAGATINWRSTVVNVHAHNLAALGTAQQRYGVRAPTGVQGIRFSVSASGNVTGQLSVVDTAQNVSEGPTWP